jgi:hypothetical protein
VLQALSEVVASKETARARSCIGAERCRNMLVELCAHHFSRVLDGREEDADSIDALASDPQEQGRLQLTIPVTTSQQGPKGKSFWQFWR